MGGQYAKSEDYPLVHLARIAANDRLPARFPKKTITIKE